MERLARFVGQEALTEEEIATAQAAEEQRAAAGVAGDEATRPGPDSSPFQRNEYNRFWNYREGVRSVEQRTSLIIEPPDGRIPLTDEAAKIQQFSLSVCVKLPS